MEERIVVNMSGRQLRRLRSESGQVTIEFALVLPFLMFIIIALVSFGIGLNDAIDGTHIANQGARLAAVNVDPTTLVPSSSYVEDYLQTQATAKDVKNAVIRFCLPSGTGNAGDPIRAVVGVSFDLNAFIHHTFTIHGKATMRLEQQATASHYRYGLPPCT